MRRAVLIAGLLLVSACSGDPRSLGITGPGPQPAPLKPDPAADDSAVVPGTPTSGTFYGPTRGPSTGASGFWGYN